MAGSTLVQRLEPVNAVGISPSTATGTWAGTSDRRQVEQFLAAATIAVGDVVMFDTSKSASDRVLYVTPATSGNNELACGVAITAATAAGQIVDVVVQGYVSAKGAAGITTGDGLTLSSTTGTLNAANATGNWFQSGTTAGGVGVTIAHGLGFTPTFVFIVPTTLTGGPYAVSALSADATNITVTVTAGESFRAIALGPLSTVATALGAVSGGLVDIWWRKSF